MDVDLFCHELPSSPDISMGPVLVTGATGYIGGRLVPELLARGYQVRAMFRSPLEGYKERMSGVTVVIANASRAEMFLPGQA